MTAFTGDPRAAPSGPGARPVPQGRGAGVARHL